jgi:hypothetical protein
VCERGGVCERGVGCAHEFFCNPLTISGVRGAHHKIILNPNNTTSRVQIMTSSGRVGKTIDCTLGHTLCCLSLHYEFLHCDTTHCDTTPGSRTKTSSGTRGWIKSTRTRNTFARVQFVESSRNETPQTRPHRNEIDALRQP